MRQTSAKRGSVFSRNCVRRVATSPTEELLQGLQRASTDDALLLAGGYALVRPEKLPLLRGELSAGSPPRQRRAPPLGGQASPSCGIAGRRRRVPAGSFSGATPFRTGTATSASHRSPPGAGRAAAEGRSCVQSRTRK